MNTIEECDDVLFLTKSASLDLSALESIQVELRNNHNTAIAEIAIENICSRLGVHKRQSHNVSVESISELISRIWKAILNAFVYVIDKIKSLFGQSATKTASVSAGIKKAKSSPEAKENISKQPNIIIYNKYFLNIFYNYDNDDKSISSRISHNEQYLKNAVSIVETINHNVDKITDIVNDTFVSQKPIEESVTAKLIHDYNLILDKITLRGKVCYSFANIELNFSEEDIHVEFHKEYLTRNSDKYNSIELETKNLVHIVENNLTKTLDYIIELTESKNLTKIEYNIETLANSKIFNESYGREYTEAFRVSLRPLEQILRSYTIIISQYVSMIVHSSQLMCDVLYLDYDRVVKNKKSNHTADHHQDFMHNASQHNFNESNRIFQEQHMQAHFNNM